MRPAQKPIPEPSLMPVAKYLRPPAFSYPQRTWPDKQLTQAPRWLSTDLRDGNQALAEPMDLKRKQRLLRLLVGLGFKEIEVGFPSASALDYDFVRTLAAQPQLIPDVNVSVLTQIRPDLIERTLQSLKGLKRVNVHIYNATSPVFRKHVFGLTKAEVKALAVTGVELVCQAAERYLDDDTHFGLEYSPEMFNDTEPEFALEVCNAVIAAWQPQKRGELIINLPATVERCNPNVFADQVQWLNDNLEQRENVCLSLHPHNDRGSAVAAAELGMRAGAQRIEGCLFGQGERTGNVDLVTLALNLYSQGIDPCLKLSDIDRVRHECEVVTRMEVGPRSPYAGDLVYTSFSGSHQDAIRKVMMVRSAAVTQADDAAAVAWQVPYLPVDPHDLARSYEAVVRVNAQSGKAGVAYLMRAHYQMRLPKRLQKEFSAQVQRYADGAGAEIDAYTIWQLFVDQYLPADTQLIGVTGEPSHNRAALTPKWGRFGLRGSAVSSTDRGQGTLLTVELSDTTLNAPRVISAQGKGPLEALANALASLGVNVQVLNYSQHSLGKGAHSRAVTYIECEVNGVPYWGVGIDRSITTASFKAVISAVNRALRAK